MTVDAPSVSNNASFHCKEPTGPDSHSSMNDGHSFTSQMGVPTGEGIGTVAMASRVIWLWPVENNPSHRECVAHGWTERNGEEQIVFQGCDYIRQTPPMMVARNQASEQPFRLSVSYRFPHPPVHYPSRSEIRIIVVRACGCLGD